MNAKELLEKLVYSEFMDEIISIQLKNAIETNIEEIKYIEEIKHLQVNSYQEEDLHDFKEAVEHLHKTYIYFSGDYSYKPEY
jgi:hypothetical protein